MTKLRPAILITLLVASISSAFADGRSDWKDYAWKQFKTSNCTGSAALLTCPLYHEKWDWKRNQWVDIAITLNQSANELDLTQRLTDKAPSDDDHVCVTVLAVDANGRNILAHHQNWYILHGDAIQQSFRYPSATLDAISTIHIGSKQCRKGADQDDALYARVLAAISN